MIITNPHLPPKEGYVEVEVDGVRQYQRVYSAFELEQIQVGKDRDAMLIELAHQMTLLELGVK